ncbi:hypothetical protein HZS_4668, partial [Henneguya salminicola]
MGRWLLTDSDNVQILTIPDSYPKASKLIQGVAYFTDVYSPQMPKFLENPRIFLLKSLIDPARISKSKHFEYLTNYQAEYTFKAVKRILELNPNLIFYGKTLNNTAAEEFSMRQITVVCNTPSRIMEAIALATGTNVHDTIEEIVFAKLGTCKSFRMQSIPYKSHKKSILLLENCPFPTYYSVILRGMPPKNLSILKQILNYGIFSSFYAKQEFHFLKTIFFDSFPDILKHNGLLNSFNIFNMNFSLFSSVPNHSFKLYQPTIKSKNSSHDTSLCEETKIYDDERKNDKSLFYPSSFSSYITDISEKNLTDIVAIYRCTSIIDLSFSYTKNNFTTFSLFPENHLKINDPKKDKYISSSFCASQFSKKITKININDSLHLLYYKYSLSSKQKPFPCSTPRMLEIKFNHKTDIMLKDFLYLLLRNEAKCSTLNCDSNIREHFFIFVHDRKKIQISFEKNNNSIEQTPDSFLLNIKCKKCIQSIKINTKAEIPLSSFFNLLIYSRPLFYCNLCQIDEFKEFNNFEFSFNFNDIAFVMSVYEIIPNIPLLPYNTLEKKYPLKLVENLKQRFPQLEHYKKKSVEFLINLLKNIEEKPEKNKNHKEYELIKNYLNFILQGCNQRISDINLKIKEISSETFSKTLYKDIENDVKEYKSYLYININRILLRMKENKNVFKCLNIFKDGEYSKYRYILLITSKNTTQTLYKKVYCDYLENQRIVDSDYFDISTNKISLCKQQNLEQFPVSNSPPMISIPISDIEKTDLPESIKSFPISDIETNENQSPSLEMQTQQENTTEAVEINCQKIEDTSKKIAFKDILPLIAKNELKDNIQLTNITNKLQQESMQLINQGVQYSQYYRLKPAIFTSTTNHMSNIFAKEDPDSLQFKIRDGIESSPTDSEVDDQFVIKQIASIEAKCFEEFIDMFLEENFLVDYSLIVGINNDQNIIRFAIIDYLRKYTWDKRLESAWKSGFMKATSGGGAPTIVAPMEYRMRFMDAFKLYFYPAPFKWDFMEIVKSGSTSDAYFINKTEEE